VTELPDKEYLRSRGWITCEDPACAYWHDWYKGRCSSFPEEDAVDMQKARDAEVERYIDARAAAHSPDALERLQQWLTRFKKKNDQTLQGSVVSAVAFVSKIERVLNGEMSLGIAPCIVCGATETQRFDIVARTRVMLDGVFTYYPAMGSPSLRAICVSHCPQVARMHLCDFSLWEDGRMAGDLVVWRNDAGEVVTACPHCALPLARSREEAQQIYSDILRRAGVAVFGGG
jgi:hypothetical protein